MAELNGEGSGSESGLSNGSTETFYAISNFNATNLTQLSLKLGDEIKVLEKPSDAWWWVEINDSIGFVPSNHLSRTLSPEGTDSWQDDEYFSSYGALKLHHEMLSDKPRTLAYKTAIENARSFIQGKVVMDLGCGTGILSLFCAKLGGAKKVYAVEASDMADYAVRLVDHNGLSDEIEVIQSKSEDLRLPEKVDLIVSEWMGTLLLFELMLEAVLVTRDRCLKDDGVLWPSEAELFLVPCSAQQIYDDKVVFWNDVYGFDFSPLVPLAKSEMLGRPIYNHILREEDCLSEPCSIMKLHLKTLQLSDLEFTESSFKCTISRTGTMHGFGSWFDVMFGDIQEERGCYKTVKLSTSPQHPLTHWKQDLLMMDVPIPVQMGDCIEGSIRITRNKDWRRHLKVLITITHSSIQGQKVYSKEYALWK